MCVCLKLRKGIYDDDDDGECKGKEEGAVGPGRTDRRCSELSQGLMPRIYIPHFGDSATILYYYKTRQTAARLTRFASS